MLCRLQQAYNQSVILYCILGMGSVDQCKCHLVWQHAVRYWDSSACNMAYHFELEISWSSILLMFLGIKEYVGLVSKLCIQNQKHCKLSSFGFWWYILCGCCNVKLCWWWNYFDTWLWVHQYSLFSSSLRQSNHVDYIYPVDIYPLLQCKDFSSNPGWITMSFSDNTSWNVVTVWEY